MMDQHFEHVLDPACPWYSLKSIRLPRVRWCEDQLCAWVENPANTWSNLAYILVGFVMLKMGRTLKSRPLRLYGPAGILVGFSSLIYHAGNSFTLQVFDFFGMYVFCYLLIFVNLERLGWNTIRTSFSKFWAIVAGTTFFTVGMDFTKFPIQIIVLLLITTVIGTEWVNFKKRTTFYSLRFFYLSMASMSVAISFSALDLKRIVCSPSNHWIQGHAIWHCFGALGLYFSFLHHRQFDQSLADSILMESDS
jgi:hypothetical protein